MSKSQSALDHEPLYSAVYGAIVAGATNASIARDLGVSRDAVRRFRKRHAVNPDGIQQAYTRVENDTAEGITPPIPVDGKTDPKLILTDPDTMLRQRGLDPEDWVITHLTPNMYEGPNSADAVKAGGPAKITYYQTKFSCQRKRPPELQVFAPRTDGWRAPPRATVDDHGSKLIVIVGDQQAPFHDQNLHRLFCQWLNYNDPDEGISLGDSVDFPDISRHQLDPENTATVNECLQSGYDVFRGYVNSSPDTWWRKLYGNHDERIRNLLLDKPKNQALYGIRRPVDPDGVGGEDLLALSHAMRLDELGVDVIMPHGSYELGQIVLTPKLAVRHGWLARKGSGASALATLEHLGYSVIVGHTHRQSVVYETKHEITGKLRTLVGVEAGCMCRVDQTPDEDGRIWPSYSTAPDWQQGFVTATVWPSGEFKIDTATYVNGVLMWRDQRFE